VQRYDALEDQVRTLHEEVSGRVRVVSIYSVGLHHMNRYLQRFLSRYPKANVRLEYQHPHRVYEAVEKDQADLGLVSYPRSSRTIEALGWREEPMTLVCAPGHRLAGRGPLALEDLAGENVIGFDSDLTIRREIDRVLQLHGAEVRVIMEFDNIETSSEPLKSMPASRCCPSRRCSARSRPAAWWRCRWSATSWSGPWESFTAAAKSLASPPAALSSCCQSQSEIDDGDLAAGPATGQLAPANSRWQKWCGENGAEKNGAEGAPRSTARATSSWIASSRRQI